MYAKLCSTLGIALCLLGLASTLVLAAETSSTSLSRPSRAQLVAVEGASQTYQLIDRGGRIVTATVAQSFTDIKTPNPDGTVRAVVASVDMTTNRTKVVTDAGQTLVLAMAHETLAGLQIGDAFTMAVSPQGDMTAVVPPRGEITSQR